MANTSLIAYALLGIVLIAGGFYAGYMTGQNSALRDQLTGQVIGGVQAPTPVPDSPQPLGPPAAQPVVDVEPGRYVLGEQDAPVEIVEFSDFQCPFCKRFYTDAEQQLLDTYVKTGKARITYRHFPLSFHQNAQKAAEASECAGQQGKFWEMHDLLFTRGEGDGTGLDVDSLKSYAQELQLDTQTFNTCLDSDATAPVVLEDFSEGQAAGVQGTPTFFINGQQIVGAQPFEAFQQIIESELE